MCARNLTASSETSLGSLKNTLMVSCMAAKRYSASTSAFMPGYGHCIAILSGPVDLMRSFVWSSSSSSSSGLLLAFSMMRRPTAMVSSSPSRIPKKVMCVPSSKASLQNSAIALYLLSPRFWVLLNVI